MRRVMGVALLGLTVVALWPGTSRAQEGIADPAFDPEDHRTAATFRLAIDPAAPDESRRDTLRGRSAVAVLTDEFFGGRTKAVAVDFLTTPVTRSLVDEVLNDRAGTGERAVLVFFLDDDRNPWQVNMTLVLSGFTIVRTVASTPGEIRRRFPEFRFTGSRVRIRSDGAFEDSDDESSMRLSWTIDLDVPVFDRVGG